MISSADKAADKGCRAVAASERCIAAAGPTAVAPDMIAVVAVHYIAVVPVAVVVLAFLQVELEVESHHPVVE